MAGIDPPKNLLSLIRDFASEKSQGERRFVGLKKQIQELRSELEAANSELEEAKRLKETTEQELKGFEVELALNEASIQALEARIALIQDEVSNVGSEIEELKNKEATSRDEFICQMLEFNTKIRKFQETIASGSENKNTIGNATVSFSPEEDHKLVKEATEIASINFKDQFTHVVSQIANEEEEYLAEQNIQKQLQLELIDIERKVYLMDVITREAKALENLTRKMTGKKKKFLKLTSELNTTCASFSEELQKRCICPSCQSVNVEKLGGILQANDAN